MSGCVYSITNRINGKTYVGKTTQQPMARWKQHQDAAASSTKGSPHLYAAIRKYGISYFSFEVLCYVSETEIDAAECFLINVLGARAFGYNLREGGDGGKHSEYTIQKMSRQRKGRPSHRRGKRLSEAHRRAARAAQNTPEFHEKASASAKARGAHPQTAETRAKISAANHLRVWSSESRAKARASHKGIAPANKGIPITSEIRARLRAAWGRRKQLVIAI